MGCPCSEDCCSSPSVISDPLTCENYDECGGYYGDCQDCFELYYRLLCLNCGDECTHES
jgi:hypothetical protein